MKIYKVEIYCNNCHDPCASFSDSPAHLFNDNEEEIENGITYEQWVYIDDNAHLCYRCKPDALDNELEEEDY